MTTDYTARLKISADGGEQVLRCVRGQTLCRGYTRIVIGQRGPYVEIHEDQLAQENFDEIQALHRYFVELRSELSNVMCYYQLEPVDYADYRRGMFYISPFDLYLEERRVIDPIR